jgi:hypothetical protein
MSCTALQNELRALRTRRNGQAQLVAQLPGGAGLQAAQEVLTQLDADIASTEAALELCLAQQAQAEHPVPQNILGTVEKIYCHTASKEIGADEPYLLIASFDMRLVVNLGIVGVTMPGINVVKIGPWSGVHSNDTGYASHLALQNRPAFWNLSGQGSPIAHPQDVIFLVAFLEHDGSSPDNIRGVVRTELLAARITNTRLAYTAYVTNMISNMTGTIETSRLVPSQPSLNFDDLIGGVQHLALSTGDLANLNALVPVTRTLRFTARKANGNAVNDYTVWFSFTV